MSNFSKDDPDYARCTELASRLNEHAYPDGSTYTPDQMVALATSFAFDQRAWQLFCEQYDRARADYLLAR